MGEAQGRVGMTKYEAATIIMSALALVISVVSHLDNREHYRLSLEEARRANRLSNEEARRANEVALASLNNAKAHSIVPTKKFVDSLKDKLLDLKGELVENYRQPKVLELANQSQYSVEMRPEIIVEGGTVKVDSASFTEHAILPQQVIGPGQSYKANLYFGVFDSDRKQATVKFVVNREPILHFGYELYDGRWLFAKTIYAR